MPSNLPPGVTDSDIDPPMRTCPMCSGSGLISTGLHDIKHTECPLCTGSGEITPEELEAHQLGLSAVATGVEPLMVDCPRCKGEGQQQRAHDHNPGAKFHSCSYCDGTGEVTQEDMQKYKAGL